MDTVLFRFPDPRLRSGRRVRRRRCTMAKQLSCGDLMPDCKAVIEGKDENEVMVRATEHAKKEHKLENIPPELASKVRAAIKEKS
jgi:predicted small metal-binding protein